MQDYIERFKQENPKLWNSFEQCTGELVPIEMGDVTEGEYLRIDRYVADRLGIELPQPYMVFFMLVHLKKFKYEYQPMEKVLWEIPFRYQDIDFYFTIRKFGFRLIAGTDDVTILNALLKKVNGAVRIVDRLLAPLLKEIVNKGDITFSNQSAFLRERYLYFKKKAYDLFNQNNIDKETSSESFTDRQQRYQRKKEGFFNTQAMLDAYFSFQEHLIILLLPFSDFDKELESISALITDDWTTKFNKIFKPSKKPEVMKHFDKLQSIKEKYRNKYAHGGFEKKEGSLFAKVDELGFIPVRMTRLDRFSLLQQHENTFTEICEVIEDFENYLFKSKEWARPMQLIQSGRDIYFDDNHIEKYKEAIKSDQNLEAFILHEEMLEERYTNMDW